jgi:gamma-glutamyltranspeptidase/glutathione hydrolase
VVQLWVDEDETIGGAVAAHRLHARPDGRLYAEGTALDGADEGALASAGFQKVEPPLDLASGDWNPYFGGVHAVALEEGRWRGAADPRRDGAVIELAPR